MNLKQSILNLYYMKLLKTEISEVIPNRKLCDSFLKLLNPNKFKRYRSNDGLYLQINTHYSNIGMLNNAIHTAIKLVRKNVAIPNDWEDRYVSTINLDNWLASDGYYIDIPTSILELKTNGLILCKLLEKSDTASYGLYEHNKRMLSKLIINITLISKVLFKLSI